MITTLESAAGESRGGGWRRPVRVAVTIAAVLFTGCTQPAPFQPLVVSNASLSGRTVSWTTTQPSLGAVRWGRHSGQFDHVSYPEAPTSDRAYSSAHVVALLSVAAGDSVYLQIMARANGGSLTVGPAQAFRIASAPPLASLLTWTMIDVGWGDSHLLSMPTTGEHVLIDAGERRDAVNVERCLADAHLTRLDAVVATHIHEDHIGGLVGESYLTDDGVMALYEVGELVEATNLSAQRSAYDELVALCAARSVPRRVVRPGDTDATNAAVAWDPQVHVAVLNAGGGRAIGGPSENDWINNDSIVMRLTYGNVSMIFGGDAESPVETKLIQSGVALQASLLKVHHHGSANASDDAYLTAVHPRIGLIPICTYESTGGSLPSTTVLQRLRDHGVDIYASDRAEPLGIRYTGDAGQNVTVVTDGRSYEVAVAPSASQHWPPDDYGGAYATAAGVP